MITGATIMCGAEGTGNTEPRLVHCGWDRPPPRRTRNGRGAMRRIVLALGALLLMAGSAYGLDLEKECGDFSFLRSPDSKVYRGTYEGTYPPGTHATREAVLVVIETTRTNRVLLIDAGRGRRGLYCQPMVGSIEGQTLTARTPWRGNTLTFTFDGEGGVIRSYRRTRNGTVAYESEGKLRLAK